MLATKIQSPPPHSEQGTFRVQSFYGHGLNPSAPEFEVPPPVVFRTTASALFAPPSASGGALDALRPTRHAPLTPAPAPLNPNAALASYDSLEAQIRAEFTSRCEERHEHMIAVFNLDPKTTKKELTAIFFPTGASGSIVWDPKGAGLLPHTRRRYGVVFFPLKDFALRAVKTIDNFAPQRQSQLLVVRYCGPDTPVAAAAAAAPGPRPLSDRDLGVLVRLLKDSILENPHAARVYVSVHSSHPPYMETVLSHVRERTVGRVECASWPPPSSPAYELCASQLRHMPHSAVLSFPQKELALRFVQDVEQRTAGTVASSLRCVLLRSEDRQDTTVTGTPPQEGDPFRFPSPPQTTDLTGTLFRTALFHEPMTESVESRRVGLGGSVPFDLCPPLTGDPASELRQRVREQLESRQPLGPFLHTLCSTSPALTEKDATLLSEVIRDAVLDPALAGSMRTYVSDGISGCHQIDASSPAIAERRQRILSAVGRKMLNVVVQGRGATAASRLAAGEIAVHCFFYGYLPRTPVRFSICALKEFERGLRGAPQSGPGLEASTVMGMIRVLQHMVELWGTLGRETSTGEAPNDFTQKLKEVVELCESLDAVSVHQREEVQLTPSARPTPRPIVLRSSPSSGSSRRDAAARPSGVGLPPQVKLSMTDTSNGISTDGSVESSVIGGAKQPNGGADHKKDRSEKTVFVSPLSSQLTRPQIRRFLLHFGEISKVRVKPKSKHTGSKYDGKGTPSCNVFVEFVTKEAAHSIVQFFATNTTKKDFRFLMGDTAGPTFTEEDIQLLQTTCARQARNEIRENHPSDAVFKSVKTDEGRKASVLMTRCTFGMEDVEPLTRDFGHTLSFSELPVDSIPTKRPEATQYSDDDMEEVLLHACAHVAAEEELDEGIRLDFDHTIHEEDLHSSRKQEIDEPSPCNPSLMFDSRSSFSSSRGSHEESP